MAIENRRLAGRHAALRLRENDPHPAILFFYYDRGNSRLAVANSHVAVPATKVGQPIEPVDSYGAGRWCKRRRRHVSPRYRPGSWRRFLLGGAGSREENNRNRFCRRNKDPGNPSSRRWEGRDCERFAALLLWCNLPAEKGSGRVAAVRRPTRNRID